MNNSAFAIAQAKKVLYAGSAGKDDGMALEADMFSGCFKHPDQREGMNAFLAKRKPDFKREG